MRLSILICEMGTVRYLEGKIVVEIQRVQGAECCAHGLTHRGLDGCSDFTSDEDWSSGDCLGGPLGSPAPP